MRRFRNLSAAAVLAAVLGSTACGGSSTPTPTTPSASSLVTETFSGSVDVNGSGPLHSFTVNQSNGTLTILLSEAVLTGQDTQPTILLGLAAGTQTATGCQAISGAQAVVSPGTSSSSGISGTANAGGFCFIVYDAGYLPGSASYVVTVTHY